MPSTKSILFTIINKQNFKKGGRERREEKERVKGNEIKEENKIILKKKKVKN